MVNSSRQFVREGTLKLLQDSTPQECYIFLFSDLLLITRQRQAGLLKKEGFDVRGKLNLKEARVINVADTESKSLFRIDPKGIQNAFELSEKKSFVLSANSPAEKQSWLKDLKSLKREFQKKQIALTKSDSNLGMSSSPLLSRSTAAIDLRSTSDGPRPVSKIIHPSSPIDVPGNPPPSSSPSSPGWIQRRPNLNSPNLSNSLASNQRNTTVFPVENPRGTIAPSIPPPRLRQTMNFTPDDPAQSPTTSPTAPPTASTTTPMTAPIRTSTTAPPSAPTKAPMTAPPGAPTKAPMRTPPSAPITAPTKAPVTAPMRTPTTAPPSAPAKAPMTAPTNVPFQSKVSNGHPIPNTPNSLPPQGPPRPPRLDRQMRRSRSFDALGKTNESSQGSQGSQGFRATSPPPKPMSPNGRPLGLSQLRKHSNGPPVRPRAIAQFHGKPTPPLPPSQAAKPLRMPSEGSPQGSPSPSRAPSGQAEDSRGNWRKSSGQSITSARQSKILIGRTE